MSTIQKTISWSFFGLLLMLLTITSCKKDNFEIDSKSNSVKSETFSISIEEVKKYYAALDQTKLQSIEGPEANSTALNFAIEPLWNLAVLSNAQSGREIVIVPISDSTLAVLNDGRASAQLVFSKSGPDTILAQVLLCASTPEYHDSHPNGYSLSDFTGAFAFFDLNRNFQFGFVLDSGTPLTIIDSIGVTQENIVDDRSETCTVYVDIWEECIWVLDNCETHVTIYVDCQDDIGGGGNGGGGSVGTGGGGGGGGGIPISPESLGQYSWVANAIETGQLNIYGALFLGIPIHIFVYFGGELPPGFSINEYSQLYTLNSICDFSEEQLNWVEDHGSLIPLMIGFLSAHNNEEAWVNALKDVIDARIGGTQFFSWFNMVDLAELQVILGLSEIELRWIIENSTTQGGKKAVEDLYSFLETNNFDPQDIEFIQQNGALNYLATYTLYQIFQQEGWPDLPTIEDLQFYMEIFETVILPVGITFVPWGIGDIADIYLSCNDGISWDCTFALLGVLVPFDELYDLWRHSDEVLAAWKLTKGYGVLQAGWKFLINCPKEIRTDPNILAKVKAAIERGVKSIDELIVYANVPYINQNTIEHIFRGDGTPGGGKHHISALIADDSYKLVERVPTQAGCYKAKILKPDGQFLYNKDFFPDDWDELKLVDELKVAWENKTLKPEWGSGTYLGTTSEGIPVIIQTDNGKIKSAYPKWN
ncbi:MAG: EndoU domain-containing protein [Saprospiraceae bacterium]